MTESTTPADASAEFFDRFRDEVVAALRMRGSLSISLLLSIVAAAGVAVDGERAFMLPGNVVVWPGISSATIAALLRMQTDRLIRFRPVSLWVFAHDGAEVLDLPLSDWPLPSRPYKQTRWLPVEVLLP